MADLIKELSPIRNGSIKSGLITKSAVAESDYPKDALVESLNFNYDVIGKVSLRKGSTALGNSLTGDILGLYQFVDSGGTNSRLIMVNGTVVYYLAGATWTSKRTGLTAASKADFSTYLNFVFMVNGTEATAVWDGETGNSFITTGNADSAPSGKFVENFRSRMWIGGNDTYPDRLYFSSLPSSVTTPVITWDTSVATGDWIDISPSDGENMTALHRTRDALLVFKENHIYRVYSKLQTDPDPQFNVGTYSKDSIVETKNGVYFHHSTGFYRYDGGVSEISRPVIDIVNNITLANFSKVSGYLETDGDHICWSVGDVSYGGVDYTNLVVRYTISTQVWTHYSYPTQHLIGTQYNDGSTISSIAGDDDGNVLITKSGVTDKGSPIFYSVTHQLYNIDGYDSTKKIINYIMFMQEGMAGTSVTYRTSDDIANDFTKPVGEITSTEKAFDNVNISGRRIQFKLSGTSEGQIISYEGYDIMKATTQLLNFKK